MSHRHQERSQLFLASSTVCAGWPPPFIDRLLVLKSVLRHSLGAPSFDILTFDPIAIVSKSPTLFYSCIPQSDLQAS